MNLFKKRINFHILSIKLVMILFKLLGLFPVTLTVFTNNWSKNVNSHLKFIISTKGTIYSVILSIYFILIIPFSLTSETYEEFSVIESSIKILLLIFENIGCGMIIFVYIFGRNTIMDILNRLLQLETNIIKNSGYSCDIKNGKCYQIVIFITQMIISILLLVAEVIGERYGNVYPFIRIIPKLFIASVIIQYTFLLIFIQKKFNYLNTSVLSFLNPSNITCIEFDISDHNRSSCSDLIVSRLIFLRQAHRNLYEITNSITEFYSWPILFAITGSCTRMILSLYYLIMVIVSVKAASITRYILAVLWVIIFVFPIIPLTGFVTKIITEMRKTGDVVNKVMDTFPGQMKIHYELEQFSAELLHRNLGFTACGLFSLDGNLITSITSTMITYMIILVQFKDTILTASIIK